MHAANQRQVQDTSAQILQSVEMRANIYRTFYYTITILDHVIEFVRTGKTFLLSRILDELRSKYGADFSSKVAVCATTGIAATHVQVWAAVVWAVK